MQLREFFSEIASKYDRHAGMATPEQVLLRHAEDHLAEHIPGGLLIKGSGGTGVATSTPWVGIFDPDETTSPQTGVYVVYLFTADLQGLTLSLNQGITRLAQQLGFAAARQRLGEDAAAIREGLLPEMLEGLSMKLNLNPAGAKFYLENQKAYAAANIAATEYVADALPTEQTMRRDLDKFLRLYQEAVSVKRELLQATPGTIGSPSSMQTTAATADPLVQFKPKNASDYLSTIEGRTLIKSRRHERLIRQYGEWAIQRGFRPATPHPRDLVLQTETGEWLVEAKVIYRGNATHAVRAALGQLYTYRHFHYSDPPLGLIALFSEPIGDAYVEFLERCEVHAVWRAEGFWMGSTQTVGVGLAESTSGETRHGGAG